MFLGQVLFRASILTLDVEPLCRSSISWSKYCGISIPRRAFQRASRSTESKAAFRSTKATCRGWLNSRWTSDNSWWRSMHAISSYRGNRPTNTQTHKQTNRQGLLGAYNTLRRYSAKLSAQCIIQNECYLEFAGIAYITNCISKVYSIWMLTGPTSKSVPFNRPRPTNNCSRRFDFRNSSITAS